MNGAQSPQPQGASRGWRYAVFNQYVPVLAGVLVMVDCLAAPTVASSALRLGAARDGELFALLTAASALRLEGC